MNKPTDSSELIFFLGNGMQEVFAYQKKLIRWDIPAIASDCNDNFAN